MRKPVVLITGAGGEIGHGLIERLVERGDRGIVTLDVNRLDASIAARVDREITGSILDRGVLERVLSEFRVELVFHLAALLSTRSEFTPVTAHQVNVEGTLNLLEFAQHEAESHGRPVVFMYPVVDCRLRIAGSAKPRCAAGRVKEDDWAHPTTMYGCNKLYCEQLGTLLRASLQAARGGAGERPGGFPVRAVSRADLGGDRAVRRHVGLRAGDDPRRGEGASRTRASSGPTRASRSWRCRTASTR